MDVANDEEDVEVGADEDIDVIAEAEEDAETDEFRYLFDVSMA